VSEADATTDARPPLFIVKGDATAEEVAALTAVLQGIAAAGAAPAPPRPRSEWAAPRRRLRSPLSPGPAGWRASALPR
jgi:hypothetical protein